MLNSFSMSAHISFMFGLPVKKNICSSCGGCSYPCCTLYILTNIWPFLFYLPLPPLLPCENTEYTVRAHIYLDMLPLYSLYPVWSLLFSNSPKSKAPIYTTGFPPTRFQPLTFTAQFKIICSWSHLLHSAVHKTQSKIICGYWSHLLHSAVHKTTD